jgi:hypothetical protein
MNEMTDALAALAYSFRKTLRFAATTKPTETTIYHDGRWNVEIPGNGRAIACELRHPEESNTNPPDNSADQAQQSNRLLPFRSGKSSLEVQAKAPKDYKIRVSSCSSKKIIKLRDVRHTDTIATIKSKLRSMESLKPHMMVIIFSNKSLEDECTLGNYNIRNGDLLYVALIKFEIFCSYMTKEGTSEMTTFQVFSNTAIDELKSKACAMIEIPFDKLRFIFAGKGLEAGRTLSLRLQHPE